jgi:tetratricopeptide (TPR) repeat protein
MRLPALTAAAASIAAAAAMVVGTPAAAQTEQQWDSCYGIGVPVDREPPEILISGCTAVIRSGSHSGSNLAMALANRGLGYRQISQDEHALADFDQAIATTSDCLPAYYRRGSLYWERGDLGRARQDFDQIVRLERQEAEFGADQPPPAAAPGEIAVTGR